TTGFRNVCQNPPSQTDFTGAPNPDLLGMDAFHAVVFEGDRIDAWQKTVATTIEASWFNIGCAGSTLAKMQLTGHTHVGLQDGLATTMDQRQTMLKMLAADYCGNGTPYTVAGQPLHWADEYNWMHAMASDALEARWTSAGADCLNTPRIEANHTA